MKVEAFFFDSVYLDMFVLKPLWVARGNWDLSWDNKTKRYVVEEDSFGNEINALITELEKVNPPDKYHDNEDVLARYVEEKIKLGNREDW